MGRYDWLLPGTFLLFYTTTFALVDCSIHGPWSHGKKLGPKRAERSQKPKFTFDMSAAASVWDAKVGCPAFRKRHRDVIDLYSQGGFDTWPPSPRFQNLSDPVCSQMKLRHVALLVKKHDWFIPNWMEGIHVCQRCGITCQLSWSKAVADKPDAYLYFGQYLPPWRREQGNPLRVYASVEPIATWTNRDKHTDIGVSYHALNDVQLSYARIRESRQHYLSSVKREDVLLYRAHSNCNVAWRQNLTDALKVHLRSHSFGACDNNVGGRDRELIYYPRCQFRSKFVPKDEHLNWQEIAHCVISHYKFTLAIENTRLPGYVTEKMFLPLEVGTVPIYFGAPDAAEFVPPESFIAGDDFNSTESLAEYILELDKDPVRYMNYFAWRRCGVMGHLIRSRSLSIDTLPCRICEKVSAMGGKEYNRIYF